MNALPRDLVAAAIDRQPTERVPRDFLAVPEIWDKLLAHYHTQDREAVLTALSVDIRQVEARYKPKIEMRPDGTYFDELGVHRRPVKNEYCTYDEYASSPLAFAETAGDLERYGKWPNPDDWDFESLRQRIGRLHETYYIRFRVGGLFETAWALRGFEQFLMDMALEPELAHGIMERLTDFYEEFIARGLEAAGDLIDMVHTYDDIATQDSLLFSKDMWDEFIRPYHERLNAVTRRYGKKIMYHSCGAVFPMMGELAKLPIDVLNPIQPNAKGMDLEAIKSTYGDRLCFHGGIDIQEVLPHGTPEQVAQAVKRTCRVLGRGGGYILASAHHIQADTPVENIFAMYDAALEVQM